MTTRGLEVIGVDLQAKGFREYLDKLQQIEKTNRRVFDREFKGTGLSYRQVTGAAQKYQNQLANLQKGQAGFGVSAVAAGNVAAAAITKLISLILQAEAAFARLTFKVVEGGVQLNKQAELSGLILGNVFNDPKLGQAAIKFTNELAAQLRINRSEAAEFAESILPRTGGLQEFTKLLELSAIQARLTGQPMERLTFSIREALSGDFISLRDRFDLPREQIRRIQELTPELGAAGALAKVLGDEFARLGKTNISGALSANLADIQSRFTDLQAILGETTFDVLKASSEDILNLLNSNRETFTFIAEGLGLIASQATEFVTSGLTDFSNEIDFSNILELTDTLARAVNSAELIIDVLFGVRNTNEDIQNLTTGVETFGNVLFRTAEIVAVIKARLAEAGATAQNLATIFQVAIGQISQEEAFARFQDPAEAFRQSIEESIPAFEAYGQRLEEQNKLIEERGTRSRSATDAEKERIDEILKARAAEDAATRATENQVKALKELAQEAEQLQLAFTRAAEDTARQLTRQQNKLARDQFKARVDLLNDQAKEFDEFQKDELESVQKAEEKLQKERDKAAKEQKRQQDKLFRELRQAKERFDLEQIQSERRFQLEDKRLRAAGDILALQELREDFSLQQQEAKENFDLQQRQRKEDGSDQSGQAQENRQERIDELQQELDDLQNGLDQRREEFLAAQQEEFNNLLTAQAEQRLALRQSYLEQQEDARINQQRQLEDLGRSLVDQKDITTEGVSAIASEIEKIFGQEGVADTILSGFTARSESEFRELFEEIEDIIKSADETLSETLSNEKIRARSGGNFGIGGLSEGLVPQIPSFHQGGIVPGPMGSEQTIRALGGETVLPTHQMNAPAMQQVQHILSGSANVNVSGAQGLNSDVADAITARVVDNFEIAVRRLGRRF